MSTSLLPDEHARCRILAQRCMRTAQGGSPVQIQALCSEAAALCQRWEPYFDREEGILFPLGERLGGEVGRLCRQLAEEHRSLLRFGQALRRGDGGALYGFGALLHAHSRAETAVLLPLVEAHLSTEQARRLRRDLALVSTAADEPC